MLKNTIIAIALATLAALTTTSFATTTNITPTLFKTIKHSIMEHPGEKIRFTYSCANGISVPWASTLADYGSADSYNHEMNYGLTNASRYCNEKNPSITNLTLQVTTKNSKPIMQCSTGTKTSLSDTYTIHGAIMPIVNKGRCHFHA